MFQSTLHVTHQTLWMSSGSWIVFISFFDLWYTTVSCTDRWCLRTSMHRHEPQGLICFFLKAVEPIDCYYMTDRLQRFELNIFVFYWRKSHWMPCRGGADKQLRNSFAKSHNWPRLGSNCSDRCKRACPALLKYRASHAKQKFSAHFNGWFPPDCCRSRRPRRVRRRPRRLQRRPRRRGLPGGRPWRIQDGWKVTNPRSVLSGVSLTSSNAPLIAS